MHTLLALARQIDRISRLIGKSLIWLILFATVISALNAIARKAFNVGSNAFLEIQWYLFAAVFLLGAGHTFLENAHVRIDVLSHFWSRKTRMWVDICGIVLFVLPMCYFMVTFAWPIVAGAYASWEMSSNAGGLIRWPAYVLVPLGFGLLALQALSELIKRAAFLTGHGPDPLGGGDPDDGGGHALPTTVPTTGEGAQP
jgi:TRAP-type mannitol/chloroaromatic compound transport system permease small subunit